MNDRSERKDRDGAWAQSLAISFRFLFIAIFVLAAGWIVSNCRLIPADSRAVVLRFGTVAREEGPGLLLALPRPFEEVLLLPSSDRQIEQAIQTYMSGDESPYAKESASSQVMSDPRENASLLLTGDMSVVAYRASIFYRIIDAKAYVLTKDQVASALERLFVSSAIAVTASRDLDTILVARPEKEGANAAKLGRERFRVDLANEVNRRLTQLAEFGGGFGVVISRVDLFPQFPAEAKTAFDRVLVTLQTMESQAAQARTEAEQTRQKYAQSRDRLATDTQAQAAELVREAQTRTAAIAALAQEPGIPGDILMSQIFSDRVGGIMQKADQVMTTDGEGGTHLILSGAN